MRKNFVITNLLILTFVAFVACSSDNPKAGSMDSVSTEHAAEREEAGNPEFKDEKITAVYQHYIHLKSALVKSDGKESKIAASSLNSALMTAGNTKGADLAAKISGSKDLAVQRSYFEGLTAEVESLIKKAGLKSGKIFKQYCPMANNGDGGFWLASESSIKNPYYGDEMLTCGEVKEEIQ